MGGTPPVGAGQTSYSYSGVRHLTGDQAVLVKGKPPRFFEANSTRTSAFSVQVGTSFNAGTDVIQGILYMRPDVARAYNQAMLVEKVPFSRGNVPEGTQVITGAQFDPKPNPARALAERIGPTKEPQGNPVFKPKAQKK